MLTLKEFVKETLMQIAGAVVEARDENNINTSPRLKARFDDVSDQGLLYTHDGTIATMVKFDVAVTAEEEETAKGRGGVKVVSVFQAGGELESRTVNNSVSRVSFTFPLEIPK